MGYAERENVLNFEILDQLLGGKKLDRVDLHFSVFVFFYLHFEHADRTWFIANEKLGVNIVLTDIKSSNRTFNGNNFKLFWSAAYF